MTILSDPNLTILTAEFGYHRHINQWPRGLTWPR
jgi:hypothetical protein